VAPACPDVTSADPPLMDWLSRQHSNLRMLGKLCKPAVPLKAAGFVN
jgi:hypothetical protein